jgi:hypothetical protein
MNNPLDEDFTPLFTSGDPEFDGEIEFTDDSVPSDSNRQLLKPFFYAVPGVISPQVPHTEEELKAQAKAVEATRIEEQFQEFGSELVSEMTRLIKKVQDIENQIGGLMKELSGLRANFIHGVSALKAQTASPVGEKTDPLLEMELERSFAVPHVGAFTIEDDMDELDGIDIINLISAPEEKEESVTPDADILMDHYSDPTLSKETSDSSTEPSITLLTNLMDD